MAAVRAMPTRLLLPLSLALAFVSGLAVLSGCSRNAAPDALFPLSAGHRWTYRVVTQWSDGKLEQETLSLSTLGEESIPEGTPGADAAAAWRRHGDDGRDYWLRADASGIRRIATRSLFDATPKMDPPQRYVLKAPYAAGTQWEASTTAYMLTRRFDFPYEVRYTYGAVPMTYRIEADNDSVDTPAGKQSGCVRVKGTATIRVYAHPVTGWSEMPLTTREWYCRGVGLVRVERTEPVQSSFMTGGTRVMALESFK